MTTLDAPPGDAGPDTAVLELRDRMEELWWRRGTVRRAPQVAAS